MGTLNLQLTRIHELSLIRNRKHYVPCFPFRHYNTVAQLNSSHIASLQKQINRRDTRNIYKHTYYYIKKMEKGHKPQTARISLHCHTELHSTHYINITPELTPPNLTLHIPELQYKSSYEVIYVKSVFIKTTRNKYNILPMWERWLRGASERVPCVARGEVVDTATELEKLTSLTLLSSYSRERAQTGNDVTHTNTLQRSPSGESSPRHGSQIHCQSIFKMRIRTSQGD